MSRKIEDLTPDTAALCRTHLTLCEAAGVPLIIVHTLRTYEEQALIYEQGRSRPGPIVTHAKPGSSWHNFGRAYDVAFKTGEKTISWDGPWEQIGALGESIGLTWGGRWMRPDRPHFECRGGITLAQAREEKEKANA